MANHGLRVQWEPSHGVGNELLDQQHRTLAAHCNALADGLADTSPEGQTRFRQLFAELMTCAREHFATEAVELAAAGGQLVEATQQDQAEFEYLAAEIITTEHFSNEELQRFLALWWTGHIRDCVRKHGELPSPQ